MEWPGTDDAGPETPLTSLELLLGEGTPEQRAGLRQRSGSDPAVMLALAEDVAFLEQCRELRTEPSPLFATKLHAVLLRAERVRPSSRRPAPTWRGWLLSAAAALVTTASLWTMDPLGRRRAPAALDLVVGGAVVPAAAISPPADRVAAPVADSHSVAWQSAVAQMRQRLGLEPSGHLREALETGLRDERDPLGRWLDPRNAVVLMRFDHELRASAEARREALVRQGGLPAVDERVQELATAIAGQLSTEAPGGSGSDDVAAVALAVRALLAAGTSSAAAERAGEQAGNWLSARLETLHDAALVEALAALVEVAAVTGRHFGAVEVHGRRLVDGVLRPDAQNWERSLPALLANRLPAATVGDASRLLQRLPGFGLDAGRCTLVRRLLLGQLRARRDAGQDGPEVLAALVYGCDDLLAATERAAIEVQLRRWKPARLVPDFRTVQQLAWAVEPGRAGFTRLQGELRQLAVCADPGSLAARAAFCLCLSTNFAAFGRERSHLAGGI